MTKKLTITVSDDVYRDLQRHVGRRGISRFFDEILRKRLADRNSPKYWLSASEQELAAAYEELAAYGAAQAAKTKRR